LKNRYLQRLNLIFVFSREQQDVDLYNGRINAEKCEQLFSRWIDVKALDAAFICGPQEMTETVRDSLKAKGMAPERIHFELFAAAGSSKNVRPAKPRARSTPLQPDHRDQRRPRPGLRPAAQQPEHPRRRQRHWRRAALLVQGRVCSTCKCKVIEGEVEMDSNHALEDYEVAAGYVLSCQTYPVSDKVVLDFDQLYPQPTPVGASLLAKNLRATRYPATRASHASRLAPTAVINPNTPLTKQKQQGARAMTPEIESIANHPDFQQLVRRKRRLNGTDPGHAGDLLRLRPAGGFLPLPSASPSAAA
jgi:hypothetical protein